MKKKYNILLFSGFLLSMSNFAWASPCRADVALTVENNTNTTFLVQNAEKCSCAFDYSDTLTNVFPNNSYFVGPHTKSGTIYIDQGGSCSVSDTNVDLYFYDTNFSNVVGQWVVHYSFSEEPVFLSETNTVTTNSDPNNRYSASVDVNNCGSSNKPCTGTLSINYK